MRKHVKTVHGAEFYANKKHKGTQQHDEDGTGGYSGGGGGVRDGGGSGGGGSGMASPRSDRGGSAGRGGMPSYNNDGVMGTGKSAASLSSPSIKSESDAADSPGHQNQQLNSPGGFLAHITDYGAMSFGGNGGIGGGGGGGVIDGGNDAAVDDTNWLFDEDDIEVWLGFSIGQRFICLLKKMIFFLGGRFANCTP